jgi:hypothetical protein
VKWSSKFECECKISLNFERFIMIIMADRWNGANTYFVTF